MTARGLVLYRPLYHHFCRQHVRVSQVTKRFHPKSSWTNDTFNTISSFPMRSFTTSSITCQKSPDTSSETPQDQPEQSLSIFQRFKVAYKEHGKVLIGVHLVTSSVWFGAFYYAAASGFDITPLLVKIGASDKVVQYLSSSVGNVATAYVMYKIVTPARYTVTVLGTYSTVKYLRKLGYMEAPPEGDSIRELMKDSQSQMKDKLGDMKGDMKDKYSELKDDVKDKMKKRKEKE